MINTFENENGKYLPFIRSRCRYIINVCIQRTTGKYVGKYVTAYSFNDPASNWVCNLLHEIDE